MWNQAQIVDSSIGNYAAAPVCRGLEDDPVLAPERDVSGKFDEARVVGCMNGHLNSTAEHRTNASVDVRRAQCLVVESARIGVDDAITLLHIARGLATGEPVLQAVTFATAGERYGREGRELDAMAAYQAAAEQMLTANAEQFANSVLQFGGSVSLKELVAPVAHQRQATQYYRAAAVQAFDAGSLIRQAQMLQLVGENLEQLSLELPRPANYSDEDFDSLIRL